MTVCSLIIQNFLSKFVSAYRKHYSASHALISLTENREKNLKNNKTVDDIFMDLLKGFDGIPHELVIAKMEAYGCNDHFLIFLFHT